jgi:hypothetical protein
MTGIYTFLWRLYCIEPSQDSKWNSNESELSMISPYIFLVNSEVTRSYPLFLFLALEVEGPRFKLEEIRSTAYIRHFRLILSGIASNKSSPQKS